MNVLQVLFELLLCFFAVVGFYFFTAFVCDKITAKNAPSKSLLLVQECDCQDIEYLVRHFESKIISGDFCGLVTGVAVSKNLCPDDEVISRLADEFGNVYLL